MSNFIISRVIVPLVKLAYPKIDWITQKEVKTNIALKISEIKNDSGQEEFKKVLVELYNWMSNNK